MSGRGPDFRELVGDVDASEEKRLRAAHDLLVAAGPPPDLPPGLAAAPEVEHATVVPLTRPTRWRRLALAAALAVAVFALGVAVGDRSQSGETFDTLAMTGTASAPEASASIELFDADAAGNWPMELRVVGLPPAESGRPYELWLTRDGRPYALCGSFLVEPDGTVAVPMNAPYDLREFDGWVVVERGSQDVLLTT